MAAIPTHRRLVLFGSVDQVNAFHRVRGRSHEDNLGACFDFEVGASLRRSGQEFVFLHRYLRRDDVDRNYSEARHLTDSWFLPFLGQVAYGDIHPAETMKDDLFWVLFASLNVNVSLARLLEEERIQAVTIFAGEGTPFWGSEFKSPIDAPFAAALHRAVCRGIPVEIRRSPAPARSATHTRTLYPCRSDLAHFEAHKNPGAKRVVAFLSVPQDYAEQAPLAAELLRSREYVYIPVRIADYFPMSEFGGRELCFAKFYRDNEEVVSAHQQLSKAWECFSAALAHDGGGVLPDIFLSRFWEFQWRAYWNRLLDGIRWAAAAEALVGAVRPDVATFGTMHGGHCRMLLAAVEQAGVAPVTIMHGGLTTSGYYKMGFPAAGTYCVWGEADRDSLADLGLDVGRVRVVGSLRHPDVSCRPPDARKPVADLLGNLAGARKRIMILSAGGDIGMRSGWADLTAYLRNWERLAALAARRTDLCFFIKAHPRYDDYEFYESLSGPLHYLTEHTLEELLPFVDVAVLVNSPTTAALECLAQDVPLLYLTEGNWSIPANTTLMSSGPWVLDSTDRVEPVLDELLAGGDLPDRVLRSGQDITKRFWGEYPKRSLERALSFFEEIPKARQAIQSIPILLPPIAARSTKALVRSLLIHIASDRFVRIARSWQRYLRMRWLQLACNGDRSPKSVHSGS